ncbi:hypothetical protein D3C84_1235360 [compost metagenome]
MMLGHPERVVAQPVHELRHRLRLVEDRGEPLVRIEAVVDRDAAVSDILQVDMAGEQAVEFPDHAITSCSWFQQSA